MIKIQFYLSNLCGGGAQRTVVNVLRYLNRNKFNPSLKLLDYNKNMAYAELIPGDVEITNIDRRGRYSVFKIAKIIREEQPDIVFGTLPQVNIALTLGRLLSLKRPRMILRETNYRKKAFNSSWLKFQQRKFSYKRCDQVVSLSKGVAKQLENEYNIDSEKINVIYNPVDLEHIKNRKKEPEANYEAENLNFIACGRLSKQKNFEMLIEAAELVKNKYEDGWVIRIMGKGSRESKLKDMIERKGLEDKVKLIGFKNNPFKYMYNSDVFVLSSKWEGFGHVVVEALACNTPVLSTDCPHGPAEILSNEQYGWLVSNDDVNDMAEKMMNLIENPTEINKKAKIAAERAEDFAAEKIVREYEDLFFSLVE